MRNRGLIMAVAANYDSSGAVNGISFPLINPSSDIQGMFEDMSLYSESIGNYKSPFRISSVTGFQFATPSQASLIVLDNDGEEVVNTTGMDFYQEAWGSNRVIYTWKNSTKFLSVVQYVGYGAVLRQNSFSPISAVIDSRVYLSNSKKVSSVTVGGQTYTGDIKLVAGNNISFLNIDSVNTEGSRLRNLVQVSSSPGYGTGIYSECPPDCVSDYTTAINGIRPDDFGNFYMVFKDCYSSTLPGVGNKTVYQPTYANQVKVNNNCLPCCECNDFVKAYKGIKKLHEAYKILGNRAMVVRATHYKNQARWEDGKTCREGYSMRSFVLPGNNGIASVLVSFCNTTPSLVGPVVISVSITASGPSGTWLGEIKKNSTIWYPQDSSSPKVITPEGTWPNFKFRWDVLRPGSSAKVKFSIQVTEVGENDYVLLDGSTSVAGAVVANLQPYSVGLIA